MIFVVFIDGQLMYFIEMFDYQQRKFMIPRLVSFTHFMMFSPDICNLWHFL